jgi:hypothetical protein
MFDGRVFQQTVDIPMGAKCPFSPTFSFIRNRQNSYSGFSRQTKQARAFNFTFRYEDDVLSLNNCLMILLIAYIPLSLK